NFLGTTDNQAFEIRVNNAGAATGGNQRVMRFEPNATSANIIGGFNGNSVTAGAVGATIAGGGANGSTNSVTDDYGVVGGGAANHAGNNAGGTSDAQFATVGGGYDNTASANYSTVGGGYSNSASGDASTVGGGYSNTASGTSSTVGGGYLNTASNDYSTVGGGVTNSASGTASTVGGGVTNSASGDRSTVGGGYLNTASGAASTVGGGYNNTDAGDFSAIPGGHGLTLDATAARSFGFHANNSGGTRNMTISTPDVAVFGNADLWLANNDGAASELRFFENYSGAGAFPNTANYTAFKAQAQTGDITYTLPASAPAGAGNGVLTATAGGTMSWGSHRRVAAVAGTAQVITDAAVTATSTVIVTISGTLAYGTITAQGAGSFTFTTNVALATTDVINYIVLP
ncbi:MAG: hypothetical protein IT211_06945, partial [Armatimonadetes bacterium]|nr:hypothetical protein [Armatimonadota bacterium]